MRKILWFLSLFIWASPAWLAAQQGTIAGHIIDMSDRQPMVGVNVIVQGTQRGAASAADGSYRIEHMPAGVYTLVFRMIGYEQKTVTDVSVKPGKTARVDVGLQEQILDSGEEIVVTARSYFEKAADAPASTRILGYEDVRRSPGAREDISRMLQNLPGVTPTTDDRNDLVIRGGSPSEVLFLVDNIEIPNPNHFGTQGASGGPISLLNNEFISDVDFHAGGFPAKYGNKVSGVLDIHLREGNREKMSGLVDLGFAGAGGQIEGPLAGGKGSYMFSVHRSYLELLESAIDVGGLPVYTNMQARVVRDLGSSMKLSLLAIGGDDFIDIDADPDDEDLRKSISDTIRVEFIRNKTRQLTVGGTLTKIWNERLFSSLTLSHSYNRFFIDFNNREKQIITGTDGGLELKTLPDRERDTYDNISVERLTNLKFDASYLFGKKGELNWGVQARLASYNHEVTFQPSDSLNETGGRSEPYTIATSQSITPKTGAYVSWSARPSNRFTLTTGLRYDYFDLLKTHDWSPSFSASYVLTDRLTINAAIGRYYQSPEFVYITGDPENKNRLKSIRSDHYILGFDYLLREATLFSLEVYRKNYDQYPVASDPAYSFFSTANSGSQYGSVGGRALVSKGQGRAYGVEVLLQKKLVQGLYGLVSYSWSRIEHKALDGIYRAGEFDNRLVANVLLGYRLNKNWEFSLKWRYAGGRPYTPFDEALSRAVGQGILDVSRVNGERVAAYKRLDLRYDYRKYFKNLVLISYFSIENVLNIKNDGLVLWNKNTATTTVTRQTGFLPVGGVRLEF